MVQMYKCDRCGNIFIVGYNAGPVPVCCGQPMRLITANTEEAAFEKHIPVVSVDGKTVIVTVGEVQHPMVEEHSILWVALESDKGLYRKHLEVGAAPEAVFALADEKPVAVYAYCNLHGLWKQEL